MKRLVVLVLAVVLLPSGLAAGATPPWSGYRIVRTGAADGGFVGARLHHGQAAYRIDPRARRDAGGYRRARFVARDRRTARAAWILSKYGAARIADQAAAVDVATYALLASSPVNGRRAGERLRQTGNARRIRALARAMLEASDRYAGPYRVTVSARPVLVGGEAVVQARVSSHRGSPVLGLPMRLSYHGRPSQTVETGPGGRATATFAATVAGLQTVRAVLSRVPEWRLVMRKPSQRGASRIVLAGRKTRLVASGLVAVRAQPTLVVRTSRTVVDARVPLGATLDVAGSAAGTPREATITLFGPFANEVSTTCGGRVAATSRVQVDADATYRLPPAKVTAAGVYVWGVALAGNAVNEPVMACGGITRGRTMPRVRLAASAAAGPASVNATVSSLHAGYDAKAVFALYGPYVDRAHARCGTGKLVRRVTARVIGNGTYKSPSVRLTKRGFYAWRVSLPAGYLDLATATPCGAAGSFVRRR